MQNRNPWKLLQPGNPKRILFMLLPVNVLRINLKKQTKH